MKNDCGHVYLLKNKSMKGFYKIGHTTNSPQARADELSRATGVPINFEVLASFRVDKFTSSYHVEQGIHEALNSSRVGNKEFFRLRNDKDAKGLFIISALSVMTRMLSTDNGDYWLEGNVTRPLQDAEHLMLSEAHGDKANEIIFKVAGDIQSSMISSMRLQDLSILMSIDWALESLSAGGVVFSYLGFCPDPLAGCEYYLEKSSFLSDWLCRQFSNILHRQSEDKKEEDKNVH